MDKSKYVRRFGMKTIGIDIGTTSICLALYDTERKEITESLSEANEFLPESFRQDPERIVGVIQKMLDELLDAHGDVAGIGISTQMHGILYVDEGGRAVSDLYTWKDTGGNEGFGRETYASYLAKSTGYPMYTGYGTVTHFVLQKKGQIAPSAKAFVNIGDYLAMRLCRVAKGRADSTVAASFGGFSLEGLSFAQDRLEKAGVDTSYFPLPVSGRADAVAGSYRNVPVCWAVGDNQASIYAAGGGAEDAVSVNVGTGSQVSLFDRQLTGNAAGEIRPFVTPGYLYVQASLNGGKVYEKLASFFGEVLFAFLGETAEGYAAMERLGRSTRTTDLQVKPSLYGSRGGEDSFGEIKNLTEANFHPADLVRAYVRGMAEELYRMYVQFPASLREGRKKIVASGNGIRKNVLFAEEIEAIFGLPLQFSTVREEAAAGAAQLAADRIMVSV